MGIRLYITLEPEHGKAITLARVNDRELLTNAAMAALQEADSMVNEMASQDQMLGQLQRQEASRLRQALELVLPEIRAAGTCPTGVM
jgi:hypothetical protein